MNKLTKNIFERAYQSYLSGGDVYTYKFSSNSDIMKEKYNKAIQYLEENDLIIVKFRSEDKVKIVLTEAGIDYGNSMDL